MSNKFLFYALLIVAMICWGASWINVKVLSTYINAYEVAFLRLFLSVVAMIPLMYILKLDFKISLRGFCWAILSSIILVVYSVCFYEGTKYGTAGLGGALVTTLIPINTFILLSLIQKRKLTFKQIIALCLGAFGVLTMLDFWNFKMDEIISIENAYFLLASILWPLLTISSSKALNINPLVVTLYVYIISTLLLLFFIDMSFMKEIVHYDFKFWINLSIISLLSTAFATSFYFIAVEKLGAKEVSSFIFLVPSSALFLSALFLNEKISFSTVVGTICTVVAIYMLNNIKLFNK